LSYDGDELVVVALLRGNADVATTARALVKRQRTPPDGAGPAADPDAAGPRDDIADDERSNGPGIRLPYTFGFGDTHPTPLATLDQLVQLPWVTSQIEDSEVRVLAKERVDDSIAACRRITKNLDSLARTICDAFEDSESEKDVRGFIGDKGALEDYRDADTDERRLAQVLAAVVRGLNVAKQKHAGLIVVRRESSH